KRTTHCHSSSRSLSDVGLARLYSNQTNVITSGPLVSGIRWGGELAKTIKMVDAADNAANLMG
ncbi:MAG TPA: hypothetical protein VF074_20520, partial [Pyrinomonadaceae bacterium]